MLNEYISGLKGKKVGFVGCGISNIPVVRLFANAGISVTVRDAKEQNEYRRALEPAGVRFVTGGTYLEGITEDILFLAPAVRPDIPALSEAAARGTVITNEMQEFFKLCPAKKIAVTGSDGKSTTITLIYEILKASGVTAHIGGNIGKNLLAELDSIKKEDIAVIELSSFQLIKMTLSPEVAVVTNISPNHLDWHRGMEEYAESKRNIFLFQDNSGTLVLNYDDEGVRALSALAKGKVRFISGREKIDGVWFNSEGIFRGSELIVPEDIIKIVGRHNRYNLCAAISAAGGFASDEGIRAVAESFGGVEHRCEFVREHNGVKYYNSSIDSSPTRTKACLESFANKVIVICGGYDKNIPLEPLGGLFVNRAKHAVLMGNTADKIEGILKSINYTDYTRVKTLDEAVRAAAKKAALGDCVVLSPAASSFDMFKNFAERGDMFKNIVNSLN